MGFGRQGWSAGRRVYRRKQRITGIGAKCFGRDNGL